MDLSTENYIITPDDPDVSQRLARLRELGMGYNSDSEFDDFAQRLAQSNGAPFAMVNFFQEDLQYFAGLHVAPPASTDSLVTPEPATAQVGRAMSRDHGYCPHVVARKLPLVLDDVCDYPRFSGNPVVDKIGIRSYIGAPLIDRTGTTLGTVCIVDQEVRPWGRPGLEMIKERAAELVDLIHFREQRDSILPSRPDSTKVADR